MADAPKSFFLTNPVHDYLVAHGRRSTTVQRDLIAETEALGGISMMQIAPEQGAFMTLLDAADRCAGARSRSARSPGTRRSCIARGLADDGALLCCDVSEEWTAIAREHWERAGVADRIELRIAPALETLATLPGEGAVRPRVHRRRQAQLPRTTTRSCSPGCGRTA